MSLQDSVAPLVDLFRDSEHEAGHYGDDREWSPAQTAVWLIRELRHKYEASKHARGDLESQLVASRQEVERLREVLASRLATLREQIARLGQTPEV